MRKLLVALLVALLMAGCGGDDPLLIVCYACGEEVSIAGEVCPHCGHPTADSVEDWKKEEAAEPFGGLKVLALIRYARESNATELKLAYNRIADLTPLVGLNKLVELVLHNNQITDLTPLAGLTRLERLWLENNQIRDLTPLAGLTNLRYLSLGDNQITDFTPLAGLTNLEKLWLGDNPIPADQLAMLKKALPDCKIYFD